MLPDPAISVADASVVAVPPVSAAGVERSAPQPIAAVAVVIIVAVVVRRTEIDESMVMMMPWAVGAATTHGAEAAVAAALGMPTVRVGRVGSGRHQEQSQNRNAQYEPSACHATSPSCRRCI